MKFDARRLVNLCVVMGGLCLLAACGKSPPVDGDPPEGEADAGVDAGTPTMMRCSATPVTCQEKSLVDLSLKTRVNTDAGVVEISNEGGVFETAVDATAGGTAVNTSYVYGRFSEQGLQKLPLHDEESLTSLDWDIAFRRYVIRVNSGVSGPSCVAVARLADGTTFDSVTQVPSGLSWRTEEYYTPTCDLIPGPSGIGDPGTALASYWGYQTCVQMTGNVYVLHLRDGRYVKLQVLSYYTPARQAECNATGAVSTPSGAANFRIRWSFVNAPAGP